MPEQKMLINATDPGELRVAVVEDGRLEAYYVETAERAQTRGNIYKAVVNNAEPSLQAAFLDYGGPRHGFLQVGDLTPDLVGDKGTQGRNIKEILPKGRTILVQVVKEQAGGKGAALTTFLSIPGQYLVLSPGGASGVSRKIEDDAERKRLKEILGDLQNPKGVGFIARTAAVGVTKKELVRNQQQLLRLWADIRRRADEAKAPALIHKEDDLAVRTVRDLFTSELTEIWVDDQEVYERVLEFVGLVSPRNKSIVRLHREKRPIFARYQLEEQISTIYQPAVKLPSGGGIVIQPTEALVSVDVNSGTALGGQKLEETALAVNLEAAREIARQLRLRDLGGLVVLDFIDMRERSHQRQVRKALTDELKKDKAKTTVGNISRFGLLEMSRQRIRPPIDFGASRPCPHCAGRGTLPTVEALARQALRALHRRLNRGKDSGVRLKAPAEVVHYLLNVKRAELYRLESQHGVCLELVPSLELGPDERLVEDLGEGWALAMDTPEVEVVEPVPEPVEPPKPAKKRRRRSGSRKRKKGGGEGGEAPAAPRPEPSGGD